MPVSGLESRGIPSALRISARPYQGSALPLSYGSAWASQIHDALEIGKPSGFSGGERDAEACDIRLDAGGEDPDLAEVADEAGVQVAAEIFAERGLVAAGGAFAPKVFDRFDVGPVEPHLLIGGERENAAQGAVQCPHRKVLHLAPFRRRRLGHDRRQ